jgi:hypothetical protein
VCAFLPLCLFDNHRTQEDDPPTGGVERKLTATLCADVYGYSRLMGGDEEASLVTLTSHRKIIDSFNVQLTVLQRAWFLPQRTKNLEAYDYFLRGFGYFLSPTPDGLAKGRKMFEKSVVSLVGHRPKLHL